MGPVIREGNFGHVLVHTLGCLVSVQACLVTSCHSITWLIAQCGEVGVDEHSNFVTDVWSYT